LRLLEICEQPSIENARALDEASAKVYPEGPPDLADVRCGHAAIAALLALAKGTTP